MHLIPSRNKNSIKSIHITLCYQLHGIHIQVSAIRNLCSEGSVNLDPVNFMGFYFPTFLLPTHTIKSIQKEKQEGLGSFW